MSPLDPANVRQIADSLGLGVSATQCEQLAAFGRLLLQWNRIYNLTAVRDPAQLLTQHLADCMAAVSPIRRHIGDRAAPELLDVGSGGGLPGVVLAVLNEALLVTCVDSVGKKAAFVRQVAAELQLTSLRAVHERVENLTGPFDLVVSRAFSSLAATCSLTRHLLGPQGCWAAMKAKRPEHEIQALPADVEVFHVEPLRVPGLDAERCLVWMRIRQGPPR